MQPISESGIFYVQYWQSRVNFQVIFNQFINQLRKYFGTCLQGNVGSYSNSLILAGYPMEMSRSFSMLKPMVSYCGDLYTVIINNKVHKLSIWHKYILRSRCFVLSLFEIGPVNLVMKIHKQHIFTTLLLHASPFGLIHLNLFEI